MGSGINADTWGLNAGPPTQQAAKMAPSLTVKFAQKDDKLEVTIVRCKDLPDLDGAFNLTDAYVVVKVGEKKERTKAVGGKLDPKFDVETSTFLFDNGPDVAQQTRIRFQVMDKDTFSRDDFIGKASLKLSEVDKSGNATKLKLVEPSDGETHLSFSQTTAIYNLFAALDPENTGKIPSETKDLVVKSASREAVLLTKAFGFRNQEDPGNTEDINKLTAEFNLISSS